MPYTGYGKEKQKTNWKERDVKKKGHDVTQKKEEKVIVRKIKCDKEMK